MLVTAAKWVLDYQTDGTLRFIVMKGNLLLTLVDHAKPFKGTWQIFKRDEQNYLACHTPSLNSPSGEPACCQSFSSSHQVCHFTGTLQFYGWSIDGQSPETLRFRQVCAL